MIEIDRDQSIKMNISNIAKIGGIHRKTVAKYVEFSHEKEKSGIFVKKVKN